MPEKLPNRASIDFEPLMIQDGLSGLVEALHHIVGFQIRAAEDSPDSLTISEHKNDSENKAQSESEKILGFDEMMLISGAAFCHYAPDLRTKITDIAESARHAVPGIVSSCWLSEFICNWGVFESLSYYSAWDFTELSSLKRLDIWRLVQFEVAQGRPVLILLEEPELRPAMITGYEFHLKMLPGSPPRPTLEGTLSLFKAGSDAPEQVQLEEFQDFEQTSPGMSNWLLLARPGGQPEWTPPRQLQRARVLHWVVEHASHHREFSQEFNRHFAAGLHAFDSLASILTSETISSDPSMMDWLPVHIQELLRRRQSAARQLLSWAQDFAVAPELASDAQQAVRQGLITAATAYSDLTKILVDTSWADTPWADTQTKDEKGASSLDSLLHSLARARQSEEAAIHALSSAVVHLPR